MTQVNQSPKVLYIWKKKQRSSEDKDEGSVARLTHKNGLAGKYLLYFLYVLALSMRVMGMIA